MRTVNEQQTQCELAMNAHSTQQHNRPIDTLGHFAEAILWTTQRAEQMSATIQEQAYAINGQALRLCFVNAQMATLLAPALAHLASPSGHEHPSSPMLTVYLWDSASTGLPLPTLPPALHAASQREQGWGVHSQTATQHLFFQPAHRVLSLLDRTRNIAVFWTEDAKQLPIYEGGAPLLLIWHWWLGDQKYQVVHGAAVGTEQGAALLVGKSGSGKSTTALRCLHDGLFYLGDDYCLLGVNAQPVVYSLYCSGKIHRADLARFPRLQQAITTASYTYADKQLYFFHEPFGAQLVRQLPVRAVLIPTIADEPNTQLKPASPAEALVAVAPSTTFQLPGAHAQTIRQLSQVLRQIPCYWLRLGTELAQIPPVIEKLLNNYE